MNYIFDDSSSSDEDPNYFVNQKEILKKERILR